MRKVVGYLLMTLDGVVEEPGEWLEHFDEDMTENMSEGNGLKRLKFVSSKPTRTGVLILTYRPIQH